MDLASRAVLLVGIVTAGCAAGNNLNDTSGSTGSGTGGAPGTSSSAATSSAGGSTATAGGQGGMGTGGQGGATTSSTTTSSTGTGGGETKCGNGVIDPGEQCDGSNLAGRTCGTEGFLGGTLGCTTSCKLDTALCGECNDGVVTPALGEDCDFDAMGVPLIGATCQSLGYPTSGAPLCEANCKYDLSPCACGNGMIEGAEECDGSNLDDQTCASQGFTAGTLACDAQCKLVTTGCTECGNGVIEPGEACDGSDLGGQTCVSQGFAGGALGCNAQCQLVTTGCTNCGNGVVDAGEPCDGANLGGHTCVSQGFTGGSISCSPSCTLITAACTKCGNNVVEAGEQCDDGNTANGDGCSATCQTEITTCDPDGVYAVIMGGPISYSCCAGLVSVNVSSFIFGSDGASIQSAPSNPVAMTGAATTCPSGSFSATASISGGCTEVYTLQGTFTGPNTWTGTYSLSFIGSHCSCFGGQLGTPCVGQTFPITAMR